MLRHADTRLIDKTYLDQTFVPVADAIARLPGFGAIAQTSTQADDDTAQRPAQRADVSECLSVSDPVAGYLIEGREDELEQVRQFIENQLLGIKTSDPASIDTGSEEKRVKGVEPSTFTLATRRNWCYSTSKTLSCTT